MTPPPAPDRNARMNEGRSVRRWETIPAAPVGVAALQLYLGFPRFVAQRAVAELKRVLAMMLRKASDPMRREKFFWIPDTLQQALELGRIRDREYVPSVSVADPVTGITHQVRAILDKPLHIPQESRVRLQFFVLQHFDGIERNQSHQRAQSELVELAI